MTTGIAERSLEEAILRSALNDYVRLYAFLSQILTFADADLEKLYVFARLLRRYLPVDRDHLPREIQQNIDMESYRIQETFHGSIALERGQKELQPIGAVFGTRALLRRPSRVSWVTRSGSFVVVVMVVVDDQLVVILQRVGLNMKRFEFGTIGEVERLDLRPPPTPVLLLEQHLHRGERKASSRYHKSSASSTSGSGLISPRKIVSSLSNWKRSWRPTSR